MSEIRGQARSHGDCSHSGSALEPAPVGAALAAKSALGPATFSGKPAPTDSCSHGPGRGDGADAGMGPFARGALRLALIVLAAVVLGLVFAAYQHPALLIDFGNLLLMCG